MASHFIGVPYLPGAAVKGLVRAWVEDWDEDLSETDKKERCRLWFGSEDKNETTKQSGELIFFDALPIEPVTLAMDVMTPHMDQWYEKGGKIQKPPLQEPEKLPADWHNPTPVPFLVVKQARFLFAIAPRCKDKSLAEQAEGALGALGKALAWLGAGAKTAVGYGRMKPAKFKAARSAWVDETLAQIGQQHRCKEDEALRGKILAEAWQSLPDSGEKAAAIQDIRSRWQEKGWWDQPQGKAAKAAKAIYLKHLSGKT